MKENAQYCVKSNTSGYGNIVFRGLHLVAGFLSVAVLFGVIASKTILKQPCPDSLFYYRECMEFQWLNVAICLAAALSIIVDLLKMSVFMGNLDRYLGAIIGIVNNAVVVLLIMANADIVHYDVVYTISGIIAIFNAWAAFSFFIPD